MPKDEETPFVFSRLAPVDAQVKELAQRAKMLGKLGMFVETMKRVYFKVRLAPLTWGDPLYRTRKEGGLVCRGLETGVVVQYVVYEKERSVCLLSIDPVARWWST